FLLFSCGEEDSVIRTEAHLVGQTVHGLLAMVLGDRSAPLAAFPGCIAQSGKSLGACPFVHVVEKLAALIGRARGGNGAYDSAFVHDSREQAEPGAFKLFSDVA